MKLVVGLGNPGKEYENTRHNVGFNIVDLYLKKKGLTLDKEKINGKYTKANINNEEVIILEPQTYMNLSGESIKSIMNFYKIKLKENSSSGGHNGIKNIEDMLGTNDIKRLKVCISKNKLIDTKDYVLGKFTKEDKEILDKIKEILNDIIDYLLEMNIDL